MKVRNVGPGLVLVLLGVLTMRTPPAKGAQHQDKTTKHNKFGMGVYNDTVVDLAVQLSDAQELVGEGGYVILSFSLLFKHTGDPSSCLNGCRPENWVVNTLKHTYALGLKPLVRLGQWSRQIRNFSDDALHRNYTSLARAYRTFAAGLPRQPQPQP